jgi:hypothetical protein
MKKKKLFPSQKTYQMNNPSTTFRLKKDDKKKLTAVVKASEMSLSRWITAFLRDELFPYSEHSTLMERIAALEEKNKELASERRFNVPCPVCQKPMMFSSKHSNWKTEIYPELVKTFGRWHHHECKPS